MPPARPSRLRARLAVLPRAMWRRARSAGRRRRSADPARILVAHNLLLGDTLMLTPLLAKLRQTYPKASVFMTASPSAVGLYVNRPYGVQVLGYDPRDPETVKGVLEQENCDLALVPGDNRHSWLAAAAGARWIVAFGGDRPAYKSWPADELHPYPAQPAAWGDMVAGLISGPAPAPYAAADWPLPECRPFPLPERGYCVLHVGASTPLKRWEAEKWRTLSRTVMDQGLEVVWSGGRGEQGLVQAIDPEGRHRSYAGALDLPQLSRLLKQATLLVCPDTGIAHLGRIVGVPTVVLFGPGSSVLSGAGGFWRNSPYRAVGVPDFACRDQRLVFKREVYWVRRCARTPAQCSTPRCMHAITVEDVLAACRGWLAQR